MLCEKLHCQKCFNVILFAYQIRGGSPEFVFDYYAAGEGEDARDRHDTESPEEQVPSLCLTFPCCQCSPETAFTAMILLFKNKTEEKDTSPCLSFLCCQYSLLKRILRENTLLPKLLSPRKFCTATRAVPEGQVHISVNRVTSSLLSQRLSPQIEEFFIVSVGSHSVRKVKMSSRPQEARAEAESRVRQHAQDQYQVFFLVFTRIKVPRRSLSLKLRGTRVYAP